MAREQGDLDRARRDLEEGLAAARQTGAGGWNAPALKARAELALLEGETGVARGLLEECRALWGDAGHTRGVAEVWALLAQAAAIEGDPRAVSVAMQESLVLFERMESPPGMVAALEGLAFALGGPGRCAPGDAVERAERAVLLFAAAQASRKAKGAPLSPRRLAERDDRLAALRATLGDAAFDATWEAGGAVTCGQVVARLG